MKSSISIILCLGAVIAGSDAGRPTGERDVIINPDQFSAINTFFATLSRIGEDDTTTNINNSNKDSSANALFEAALTGNENLVEDLIRNGANVNSQAPNGWSALHMVAWKGHNQIANLLLRNDADINLKTNLGWTAFHTAAFNGHKAIVEMLYRKGANINLKTNEGWTALHTAVYKGHWDVFEFLIRKGADISLTNDRGNTALHIAAMEGREILAEELVIRGANIDQKNIDGWTALSAAAWHGHDKVIDVLLKYGASIDVTDKDIKLPVFIAAERDHRNVIEVLNKFVANHTSEHNLNRPNEFQAVNNACDSYSQNTRALSTPIESREFPWMAALLYLSSNNQVKVKCGGTIISNRFILTAAHCVKPSNSPVSVQMGKPTNPAGGDATEPINMPIKEIFRHPSFSESTFKNDIALIQVRNRIQFNEYIWPACLYTDTRDPKPNVQLIVTGWSRTTQQSDDSSDLVKKYISPLQMSLCDSIYSNDTEKSTTPPFRNGFGRGQLCAMDFIGTNDSCAGDGGGPLQTFNQNSNVASVVGIVSFGISPCGSAFPSIYTRVAHYLDWIESIVWPIAETPPNPQHNVFEPRINAFN